MAHVNSADGTPIGYDRLSDEGPVVVLVGGGLDDGSENLPLGEHLTDGFTVVSYRRRGRGDSGDHQPYALEREVEDLAAVIQAVGGRAHLFGASSGGALALEAAAAGLPVDRLAIHEVPYQVQDAMVTTWQTYRHELDEALDAGDPDLALRLFMRLAGSSEQDIAGAEAAPVWPALRELAPTLRYDAACLGDGPVPVDRLATVQQPVLLTTGVVIDPHMGGLPLDFFGAAADAAAAALPDARRDTLEVQGHVADPTVLGPLLRGFFDGARD
ncbi:alpha/beta fold hydrolase [Aeromicrobium sp. Leaf350]|uniref:alpha/beta fold hydrolase n=1 Tax=Aeromicrobium sp. Leaf350 TaxID=2876565 RepID=UPI001E42E91D|nr:alpha/beta fold hydrolase [Aeromicrobium sp. Leaf350]